MVCIHLHADRGWRLLAGDTWHSRHCRCQKRALAAAAPGATARGIVAVSTVGPDFCGADDGGGMAAAPRLAHHRLASFAVASVVGAAATVSVDDIHFFVIHRALHWKPLYRSVHIWHHRSVITTPFSA